MVKVKEIKKTTGKKSKVTVKSVIVKVRENLNKKQIEKVSLVLEEKFEQLDAAEKVVKKIKAQIKAIEAMDINDLDLDGYEFEY